MAQCKVCNQKKGFFELMEGICKQCLRDQKEARELEQQQLRVNASELDKMNKAALANIILTTETAHNLTVEKRLGVIATEVVIGQHLGKEFLTLGRDLVGGRSKSLQKTFREAREIAFDEIREQALELGAHAVVGIDIDYLDVSGAGTMPMVVVSGTAVILAS